MWTRYTINQCRISFHALYLGETSVKSILKTAYTTQIYMLNDYSCNEFEHHCSEETGHVPTLAIVDEGKGRWEILFICCFTKNKRHKNRIRVKSPSCWVGSECFNF